MEKQTKRDCEVAARVRKVMRITGAKKSTVYAVLGGERTNETVISTYMALMENDQLMENKLIAAVRKAVPF